MKYFFSLLLVGFISFTTPSSYAMRPLVGGDSTTTEKEASAETVEAGKPNPATNGTPAVPPPAKETAEGQPTAEERAAEAEGQPATAEDRASEEERKRTALEEILPRPDGKSPAEERGPIAEPTIIERRTAEAQPATAEDRTPEGERTAEAEVADAQRSDAKPSEEIPTLTERQRALLQDERDPAILEATSTDLKIMSLRETNIGRAILEGNIDAYVDALKELTEVFGTSFQSLLQKETAEGDTLLDLMIETTKNREFFTSEMFHLLVFHVLIDTSMDRSLAKIQPLLEKAKQANNQLAVTLLSDLATLVAKHHGDYSVVESNYRTNYEELKRQRKLKEQVIELARNHYSKTNIVIKAGFTTLAGALTAWGYKLFTNASPDAASFSYAPQISEFLAKVSEKDISIATMAIGAALAAAGLQQCGKAFSRWRKVNNIRKQY